MNQKMPTFKVYMPVPHEKQQEILNSKAKRKVIVAGRRGGKTTGVAMLAVDRALDGAKVLEAAPTSDQTTAFWKSVKHILRHPLARKVLAKNELERQIVLPNGGSIRCKTAFDADTLRGDYADLLIFDEFSLMKPTVWDEVGAPMLLDNDGTAVFIFTPKRKNHAFQMFTRARVDDTGRWQAWQFTSFDNPFLSQDALEEITRDMTENAYRQEIMAEFLDNEGEVFRNIDNCLFAPFDVRPEDHANHLIVIGCDWGKQDDYSVFSVGCADCHVEVDRERTNKIDYILQRARLTSLVHKWKPAVVLAEMNAMGVPIIEVLVDEGLPVQGFDTTASSKPKLIENLVLAIERVEWQFQNDAVWNAELEAYERKISPITGRNTYEAAPGVHDDTVISRALMLWAATHAPWLML
jgi:hypothetical protein